jgi:hypothetical protein
MAAGAFGIYQNIRQNSRLVVTEKTIRPELVSLQDGGPLIGFTWRRSGYCAGQFKVTATETATEVMVGDVISREYSRGACAGLGTTDNIAWVSLTLASPLGSRSVVRQSDGAALPVFAPFSLLRCADSSTAFDQPPADRQVLFDQVALPTHKALQTNRSGDLDFAGRLFAKAGLYIASGSSFSLIVPADWVGRLTIGWGSPGQRTTHLYVRDCAASALQKHWLAFAGGFWIDQPACVPLLVKTASQQQTVQIGLGAPCPGQAPPLPGE